LYHFLNYNKSCLCMNQLLLLYHCSQMYSCWILQYSGINRNLALPDDRWCLCLLLCYHASLQRNDYHVVIMNRRWGQRPWDGQHDVVPPSRNFVIYTSLFTIYRSKQRKIEKYNKKLNNLTKVYSIPYIKCCLRTDIKRT